MPVCALTPGPERWKFAVCRAVADDDPVAAAAARSSRPSRTAPPAATSPQRPNGRRRRGRWRRRGDRRVRDEERAVHHLPVRLAGVHVDVVVREGDREGLLPDERHVGAEVDGRVVVRGQVEVVDRRAVVDDDGVRARQRAARAFLPLASLSVMLKPSLVPTIAVSVGLSARADDPETATTTAAMIRSPQRIDHTVAIGEGPSQLLSQGENPIIRYRFSADPAESIAFSYSPLLEAVLSLHVLSGRSTTRSSTPGCAGPARCPAQLRREIAAFRFAYDGFVPEFLMPSPASLYRGFEEDLRELGAARRRDPRARLPAPALRPSRRARRARCSTTPASGSTSLRRRGSRRRPGARVTDLRGTARARRRASPPYSPRTGRPRSRRSGARSSRAWPRPSPRPAAGSRATASTTT